MEDIDLKKKYVIDDFPDIGSFFEEDSPLTKPERINRISTSIDHDLVIDCDYHYNKDGIPVTKHFCRYCDYEIEVPDWEILSATIYDCEKLENLLRKLVILELGTDYKSCQKTIRKGE